MPETYRPFTVLLIEDNAGDATMISEVCTNLPNHFDMRHAKNGKDGCSYLLKALAGHDDFPVPDIIILDINMPGMNGFEFLSWRNVTHAACMIPVIVFSSSESVQDIHEVYRLHATCYIQKPYGAADFIDTVSDIMTFWHKSVTYSQKLPQRLS